MGPNLKKPRSDDTRTVVQRRSVSAERKTGVVHPAKSMGYESPAVALLRLENHGCCPLNIVFFMFFFYFMFFK